jgi:hypothetical protein
MSDEIQRPLLLLQNLLINSLPSCGCSLPNPIDALKHLHANFSQSKPLRQLQNQHGLLLRCKFKFFSLFKVTLLRYLNQIICEVLVKSVQQLADIFDIIQMNLCAWLNRWVWDKWYEWRMIRRGDVNQVITVHQDHVQKLKFICTAASKRGP